jgi:hypothetical protein
LQRPCSPSPPGRRSGAPFDAGIDLPIYEEDATTLLDGEMPYRDFPIEYPPGALPMFVLPAVMFGDARDAQ